MIRFQSSLAFILAATAAAFPAPAVAGLDRDALSACYEAQSRLVPFSGVVLAERGGESFFRASGVMDAEEQVPMSRDARFRLASVQKVLTRVAIGRLAATGKVDLEAPVGTYVRDLPAAIAAVTVDQLLQHRSGVASLTRLTPDTGAVLRKAKNARDLLPAIVSQPLEFRPGERQQYSNGGYYLLGAVIEAVSGQDYGAYLEEAVYRPLGMTATNLLPDSRTAVRRTRTVPGQPPLDSPRPILSQSEQRGNPAGGGVTTADDLLKLGAALIGDVFLPPQVKQRLFPRNGDVWRIGQSGGTIGTNTDFAVYPADGLTVVVLSNFDPPTGELMGEVMREAARGKPCKPLSPADRPSPFLRLAAPPPSPATN